MGATLTTANFFNGASEPAGNGKGDATRDMLATVVCSSLIKRRNYVFLHGRLQQSRRLFRFETHKSESNKPLQAFPHIMDNHE